MKKIKLDAQYEENMAAQFGLLGERLDE